MYYFYILRCFDNSLYCGITNNLEKRLVAHNSAFRNGAKYTRSKQPVQLIYSEKFENKSLAMKREAEVKRWKKEKKEKLIYKTKIV